MGFFGGISMNSIYYDKETATVTLTDWSRNKLPFKRPPSGHMSGVHWPYDRMFKSCDDSSYLVMDDLAILCCLYKFIKVQAEFPGNFVMEYSTQRYKLKPLVAPLKQMMEKLYKSKSLVCLLYTSPSPRDGLLSRMPSSA